MGITNNCANFLFYAKQKGVSFGHTLMLGRLTLYASHEQIGRNIQKYKTPVQLADVPFTDEYSEPLFKILGADKVDSLDYSDYEKASIVHDLNRPIPETMHGKFDCIVDGGTIEHVFNLPVAFRNCMKAIKVGGHYVGITPANNTMGHGFYQLSPEFYYRVFSEENGFEMVTMIIVADNGGDKENKWFEVADPKYVNSRVMLVNNTPTYILLIARKVAEKEIFQITPQQSDYANTWVAHDSQQTGVKPEGVSTFKHLYRKIVPSRLKMVFRNVYDVVTKKTVETGDLGNIDASHYKEIKY